MHLALLARRGGHVCVCTQPWDSNRRASFPDRNRVLCQVFGSACSPHAYSISGFAFDRRQLYVTVNASLAWGDVCMELSLRNKWYLQAEHSVTKGWLHGPGGWEEEGRFTRQGRRRLELFFRH